MAAHTSRWAPRALTLALLAAAGWAQAATPLLGLYTFENANGDFANVVDASGNGKNPVSIGAVNVTTGGQGYEGEAAVFTPASHLAPTGGFEVALDISQGANPSGLSIGAWVNLAATGTAQGANTFFSHDDGGWDRGVWYNRDTSRWETMAYGALSGGASSSMNPGDWHLIVTTFDGSVGSNVQMYLDGTYIGQASFNEDASSTAPYLRFGAYDNGGTTEPFAGRMDNVFVFGGVLTQQDITTINANGLAGVQQVAGVAPAVPEPETYALMAAGLGVLGWVRRRRTTTGR